MVLTALPDTRADVPGRVRSRDDRQFKGAFFELYLHECLLRMGYSVTCHPEVVGTSRRPDFLAENEGRSIYVEARSASPSDVAVGQSARVNAVYESLNRLDSPNFFLWIEVKKQGLGTLRTRPLRTRLQEWLDGLDPDVYSFAGQPRGELPGLIYEDAGWKIDFRAIARSPEARGRNGASPLGILGGGPAERIRDEEGIRGALTDKGSAYGSLGAPLVVAVASDSVLVDDDVLSALYGTDVVEFRTSASGSESTVGARRPDGYWFKGDHWDHRGVSAVLVVSGLRPASVGTQRHTIWEHPDPAAAVDAFPIWRRSVIADGGLEFVEPQGSQAEWFGLGDPWPVGEPFPR